MNQLVHITCEGSTTRLSVRNLSTAADKGVESFILLPEVIGLYPQSKESPRGVVRMASTNSSLPPWPTICAHRRADSMVSVVGASVKQWPIRFVNSSGRPEVRMLPPLARCKNQAIRPAVRIGGGAAFTPVPALKHGHHAGEISCHIRAEAEGPPSGLTRPLRLTYMLSYPHDLRDSGDGMKDSTTLVDESV